MDQCDDRLRFYVGALFGAAEHRINNGFTTHFKYLNGPTNAIHDQ